MTYSETDLLHLFTACVPKELPDVRVFRRAIINTKSVHGFWAASGIAGQADAYAVVRGGLHVEFETKAARGVLAEAQKRWREFCQGWGVPHLVLRAKRGETPEITIARWIDELRVVVERKAA